MSAVTQIFLGINGQSVVSPPVANFTATPTTITSGGTVTFTDTSTNSPTSWLWNFGDGTTSTLRNPTHTYTGGMKFTVSLTATNSGGSNTKTVTNMITSNLAGNVATNPAAPVIFSMNTSKGITFGANKFVSIGSPASGQYSMMYSTDGANWTSTGALYTKNNSTYPASVAYGNGNFVGDHYNDYWSYYSSDGINWSSQATTAAVGLSSATISAANGIYLNFSSNSAVGYSTDMVNWTSATNASGGYRGGEYLPSSGRWVTLVSTSTRYSITNGVSWVTGPTLTGSMNFVGASANNGSNQAVFCSNSTSFSFAVTDGTTWTTYAAPFACNCVCYGYDRYVAISSTRLAYWSTDGVNWTQFATIPGTAVARSIAYGNGKYIVVPTSSTTSWTIT